MAVTKIDLHRQGIAGSLVDADINASAAIALSKLAEAVVQADGGQALTGNLPAGGNKITGLADGSADSDSATVGQARQFAQAKDWKDACDVATTANVTLATGLANGQTVDGQTLVTGWRVLVKNQTTGSENGIYVVPASGAASRAADADVSAEVSNGMSVVITKGTQASQVWSLTTADPITLGTTALTFTQTGSSGTGSVTSVSVVSANGFAGSVATATTTPAITVSTSITGVLKGNGTAVSAASAGTDYYAPGSTDVAITDGGTGVSTLPSGLLKGAGTSAITAATAGTDYLAPANVVTRETPTGSVNGSNTTFTLANTPISGTEQVFWNGLLMEPGAGNDYTISGATITALSAPVSGDKLRVTYLK